MSGPKLPKRTVEDWIAELREGATDVPFECDPAIEGAIDPAMALPRPAAARCYPHHFYVNPANRTVHCRKCRRPFLAFDALVEMAHEWQHATDNLAAIKREYTAMLEKRAALKKELDSLKGKVRRLRDKEEGHG